MAHATPVNIKYSLFPFLRICTSKGITKQIRTMAQAGTEPIFGHPSPLAISCFTKPEAAIIPMVSSR